MNLRIFVGSVWLWFAAALILVSTGGILEAYGMVAPMSGIVWGAVWIMSTIAILLTSLMTFITYVVGVFVFTGRNVTGD